MSFEGINPNTYSTLPPTIERLKFENNDDRLDLYTDQETGEQYYEITQSPRTQMLVSRLLKGIVPVSDVSCYQ